MPDRALTMQRVELNARLMTVMILAAPSIFVLICETLGGVVSSV